MYYPIWYDSTFFVFLHYPLVDLNDTRVAFVNRVLPL